ncbi:MAG: translocation/assembly module TamB domain-containing protein [Candidatus Neomarinimicrobiota bacterium]
MSAEFLGASGKIDFRKGILSTQDSLTINLGLGKLQVYGEVNLDYNKTDLVLQLKDTDLAFVSSLVGLKESPEGLVDGTIKLSGFLDDPSVKGNLNINKVSYGDINLSSLKSNFMINSIQKTRHGSLSAKAGNSMFRDINIDAASLNLYFMGDTVLIANASAKSDDEYIRLSGKILGFNTIQIDQIQSSLKDQFISSLEPFSISHHKGRTKFGPASLKVNEGSLETKLEFHDGLLNSGEFQMVNIDLNGIGNLAGKNFPVSGSAFANFSASTISNEFSFNGSFQIRDGVWEEMKFDDLLFSSTIDGEHVIIKELQLRKGQDLVLDISGFYTALTDAEKFLYPNPDGNISFSSSLKNFDLSLLSPYLPNWWEIQGKASGSFAMGGTASASELNFAINIDDPEFSRLNAQNIKINGRYSNNRVYFEDFISLTRTGEYRGEGYLPVDFDLIKYDEDRWIESDPVSINFNSRTSSMEFLSPYFTYIDSINGEIEIDLSIQGTPKKPVRNGSISINNGKIFYTLLDIPISEFNGRALLKDNMLIIEKLSATSNIPKDTNWGQSLRSNIARISGGKLFSEKKEEKKDNLRITGTMDMSTFFDPNLAFLVHGENVYVRTLLGEIEGIGNIDLSITGKDTISIAGDIIPDEAVLRMEFSSREDYSEIQDDGGTILNYKLNFPISDNLFVRNSQIDAEVSGNMSIQKNGNEPYQLVGELDVVDGKFYYFSDVFNIQEGNLAFDPTELNPKLNIEATTTISGEDILVSLTGELDDPVLVLQHSNNFFSQEDLLQLLTLQKRFDGNTADNIGRQSAFLFGKFLENELEKNLARSSPLFDEFEIEGSTSLIDPLGQEDIAVKVGTRVTSNLSLSYKRSFSLINPNQLGVEYRLNRNVSLVVTYDDDGQVHLKYRRKYRF